MDIKKLKELKAKAVAIHSFCLDQYVNYNKEDGFSVYEDKWKYGNYYKVNAPVTLRGLQLLVIVIAFLFLNNYSSNNSSFAILLSASFAALVAYTSIQAQKLLSQERATIDHLKEVFDDKSILTSNIVHSNNISKGFLANIISKPAIKKIDAQYSSSSLAEIQKIISFFQKLDKSTNEENMEDLILYFTIYQCYLLFDNHVLTKDLIKVDNNITTLLPKINGRKIDKILNNLEKLCQGIDAQVYHENLVRDYIGSDINSIVSYLLPYIYVKREIHILRIADKSDFFESFLDSQSDYRQREEHHDFMYEYLEYYCYKWYWASKKGVHSKPVCFNFFHQRLSTVYRSMENHVSNVIKNEKAEDIPKMLDLPFFNLLISGFDLLKENKSEPKN